MTNDLRKLAEAATPGVRRYWPQKRHGGDTIQIAAGLNDLLCRIQITSITEADVAFILATHPTKIIELLDTIEQQRKLLEEFLEPWACSEESTLTDRVASHLRLQALGFGELGNSEEHAKVYEPQAQVGEPEVVAIHEGLSLYWVRGKEPVTDADGELITLQSHREVVAKKDMLMEMSLATIESLREALAKKDAALKACDWSMRYMRSVASFELNDEIDDAITQAQGAMK